MWAGGQQTAHPCQVPRPLAHPGQTHLRDDEEVVPRLPLNHNLLSVLKLDRLQGVGHRQALPLLQGLWGGDRSTSPRHHLGKHPPARSCVGLIRQKDAQNRKRVSGLRGPSGRPWLQHGAALPQPWGPRVKALCSSPGTAAACALRTIDSQGPPRPPRFGTTPSGQSGCQPESSSTPPHSRGLAAGLRQLGGPGGFPHLRSEYLTPKPSSSLTLANPRSLPPSSPASLPADTHPSPSGGRSLSKNVWWPR